MYFDLFEAGESNILPDLGGRIFSFTNPDSTEEMQNSVNLFGLALQNIKEARKRGGALLLEKERKEKEQKERKKRKRGEIEGREKGGEITSQ